MIQRDALPELFVRMADTLVDDYDVIDLLILLTEQTAAISGAATSCVLLADERGRLAFAAAAHESTELHDLYRLQTQGGPSLECYVRGIPVVNVDLTSAPDDWGPFVRAATAFGFASVHAFPLRLRDQTIGTLSLLATDVRPFGDGDVRIVQALADVATISILNERNLRRAEVVREQLQGALNSRILIEQAKGALARIEAVDVDQAFALLRTRARRRGIKLSEMAQEVLGLPHPP